MRSNLVALKAGVAVAALAVALPTASQAFDDVNWSWKKHVHEHVRIDVDIDSTINPDNLVQVEKLQFQWGDVHASAHVNNIQNDAARPLANGTIGYSHDFSADFSDRVDFEDVKPDAETTNNPFKNMPQDLTNVGGDPVTATVTRGNVNEQDDWVEIDLTVSGTINGEVEIPDSAYGALAAVDLPRIENAATAVGNNQSIESSSALFLHDGQFVVGEGRNGLIPVPISASNSGGGGYGGGNTHTELAELLILGGIFNAFGPADISANATVGGHHHLPGPSFSGENGNVDDVASILNATVDNAATAVANNMSINLDGENPASNTMIADLTQFAYANVSAHASVKDVLLDGYTGFADAGYGNLSPDMTPIVKNVATAVGNNMSIKVGVPTMD